MDKVKFKKQVVPGDQLIMTATFVKRRGTIAVVEAKAEVDGKLAASGGTNLCHWKINQFSILSFIASLTRFAVPKYCLQLVA